MQGIMIRPQNELDQVGYEHLLSDLAQQLRASDCRGIPASQLSKIESRNWRWVQAYCSGREDHWTLGWELSMRAADGDNLPFLTGNLLLDAEDMRAVEATLTATGLVGQNPSEKESWLQVLKARHKLLTAHREDHRPGELKDDDNFVLGHNFPSWLISAHLLNQAAELRSSLRAGQERAIFDHFCIATVHPFTNGNGRVARTTAWAELRSTGLQPCAITDLHNLNFIQAARQFEEGKADASEIISAWDSCQLWTCEQDWRDLARLRVELENTGHIYKKRASS